MIDADLGHEIDTAPVHEIDTAPVHETDTRDEIVTEAHHEDDAQGVEAEVETDDTDDRLN